MNDYPSTVDRCHLMTMAVAPENVTEEDEIVQRVLELSLRHEEERRAAQAAAEIEEYEALAADVTGRE